MTAPLERAKELAELLRSHGNPADGCVACLEQAIADAVDAEREACAKEAKDYDDEAMCDGVCGTIIAERILARGAK